MTHYTRKLNVTVGYRKCTYNTQLEEKVVENLLQRPSAVQYLLKCKSNMCTGLVNGNSTTVRKTIL